MGTFKTVPPLVSIIVVAYNSSKTVIETLESIKEQTYPNIELIVSDDCSTDETCSIVQEWIDDNKEHFLYRELVTTSKNTGVSGNINRGVAVTHGEWIKSIAADDLLTPTAIEEFVNFVTAHPEKVRMCVCDVEPFAVDGEVSEYIICLYHRFFEEASEDFEKQRRRVMTSNVFIGPGYFYSKELFDEIGGFSDKYGNAEEWPFVYKVIMSGNRIYTIDKKLVRYRVSSSSLCHGDGSGFKSVFIGMYHHFFDHIFGDLIRDGRLLTAWHYALSYWGRNMAYSVKNSTNKKIIRKTLLLFSPLTYLHKLGVIKEVI